MSRSFTTWDNWLLAAAMRSSDPNFWQSADCRKLGSPEPEIFTRKRSVPEFFLLMLSQNLGCFSKNTGKHVFFEKKSQTSQTVASQKQLLRTLLFRLLRSCVLHPFPSSIPSLLSSDSELRSCPSLHDLCSETCQSSSVSQKLGNSACHTVRSSRPSVVRFPLGLDDCDLVARAELPDYKDNVFLILTWNSKGKEARVFFAIL